MDSGKESLTVCIIHIVPRSMRVRYATGAVIHTAPSDLDIYLLWGITHYVRATGDVGFLGEEEPFYPKNSTTLPPGAKG